MKDCRTGICVVVLAVILLVCLSVIWWEVEKEAIDDQAWFFAAMWLVPLLVLVGLYRLAFMMLRMILAYGVA